MLAESRRDWRARSPAIGCLMLLLLVGRTLAQDSTDSDPADGQGLPMPSKEQLATAEEEVSAVFKKEFAAATKPAAKRELAEALLQNAESEENAANRYVLLGHARRLAGEAADRTLFWSTSELIVTSFAGNPVARRAKAIEQLAKIVKGAPDNAEVATLALDVCQQAIDARNWAAAIKTAAVAKSAGGKSGDADLRKSTAARALEIGKLEQQWKAAQAAADKLKTDPADPEANLQYGRYLCALSGDWPAGLPLLAKSADEHLAAAARLDLEKPTQAADQIKAGDAWWAVGESESGAAETPWRKRAATWYQQAAPQAGGLVKVRIEKRLAELGDAAPTAEAVTASHDKPAAHDKSAPAAKHPATKRMTITLAKGVKLQMQLIPAGKYWVGASTAPNDSDRQNDPKGSEVEITQPFYIGVTEVTQTQWEAVMNSNPSVEVGPDLPVHRLTWLNCRDFFNTVNDLPATKKFKLRFPTIVEWEAACRGGPSPTMFGFGNDIGKIGDYAWYNLNAGVPPVPHPVGRLKPNAFGLYDMHGNVWEFTGDTTPGQEWHRNKRGGSYGDGAKECRTGKPTGVQDSFGSYAHGLRVACDATPTPPAGTKTAPGAKDK